MAPALETDDILVALGLDGRRAGRARFDPRPLPRGRRADVVAFCRDEARTIDQVAVHPQTAALGILREDEQGRQGYFGLPISFEGRRPDRNQPPPVLGQDDEA